MVQRLVVGVGGERPHAQRRLRRGMARARLVQAAIQVQRRFGSLAVGEEIGEGIRQPEVRRELRAVVRAAEDPQLGRAHKRLLRHRRIGARVRGDALQALPRDPDLQVAHLRRKVLRRVLRVRVQGECGAHVAARRTADAEVDAAGRDRIEHAELLGHLERAVVRQHDAGAADADARGGRRDRRHHDLGRGADDGGEAVVLADPEAVIAERLAVRRQRDRVADGGVLAAAGGRDRLVEHGELHCHGPSLSVRLQP